MLAPLVFSRQEFEEGPMGGSPLFENIRRERRAGVTEDRRRELTPLRIEQADHSLKAAEILLGQQLDHDAVNRAYNAIFPTLDGRAFRSDNGPMKARQFLRKLKAAGVKDTPSRGKGGHVYLEFGGNWTTLPFHGSDDIGPNLLREVCKQLGLDWREVR